MRTMIIVITLLLITISVGAVKVSITTTSGNNIVGEFHNKVDGVYYIFQPSGITEAINEEDISKVVDISGNDITTKFLTTDDYFPKKPGYHPDPTSQPLGTLSSVYQMTPQRTALTYGEQHKLNKMISDPLNIIAGCMVLSFITSLVSISIALSK